MVIIPLKIKPEVAFWRLRNCITPFWLDSGKGDTDRSRFSIISANPVGTYEIDSFGKAIYTVGVSFKEGISSPRFSEKASLDAFELLRRVLKSRKEHLMHTEENVNPEWEHLKSLLPFFSGGVGYLSYEARHLIEKLPKAAKADFTIPWGRFDFYDWSFVYDHQMDQGYLVTPYSLLDLEPVKNLLETDCEMRIQEGPFISSELVSNMTKETYQNAIGTIKAYIRSGDIYQMNMTQRFSAPALANKDPISLYYNLRRVNPAPFSAFLSYDQFSVMCSSPERFVKVRDGLVETRPIKGTVPRSADSEQDLKNIHWLKNSEKDKSELLMIVDLERNDLSKIADKGTVAVPELFVIESYPTVHHLVSSVTAKLAKDKDLVDVIVATFPGGSITGTPKIRAMQIIDTLEPTARNLYTGSIGYLSDCGALDFNIVIRTIVHQDQKYHYQVGGGIVWDSLTESEYEECFHKGRALVRA